MKAGRELDAKVAEFMGWKIIKTGTFVDFGTGEIHKNKVHLMTDTMYGPDGLPHPTKHIPLYSTNISAAMPVLEKVRKNFFSTTITMWDHTDKVAIVGDKRQGHNENISVLTVQAETLPLAICKFALRTKENENE